ncbi:MAG: hypothetical protein CVV00_10955 [Firmicutes bacterium HGW-Firmicutes-5]|nr:MAG: hypothetical protein CVV00_10955 [Firmicutes bacterium HGW-Firmicutes-5]
MGYYIDLFEISIKEFAQKLKMTKLLPSSQLLKENIDVIFQNIEKNNIHNIGELQQCLKTKPKVARFSEKTTIDLNYLTVLRREINSLHPEPRDIEGFPYMSQIIKEKLRSLGIKTTFDLFEYIKNSEVRYRLMEKLSCSEEEVLYLTQLVDVSRLKYVNQTFATLLVACGYGSIEIIKKADYKELYETITAYNKTHGLYKGKIGLKDMAFFVESVPKNIESIT